MPADTLTPIRHDVDLSSRRQHLVTVTTTVPADLAAGARVLIATWTPGSYVERDYVHHLQSISATDDDGDSIVLGRDGRTAWRLPAEVEGAVTLSLEWYANDLTVRTNHVDDQHALLVPPATFPLVDGADDRAVVVTVGPTGDDAVWSLLPRAEGPPDAAGPSVDRTPSTFVADDQLHLVDSAFEVGRFRTRTFEAEGVEHTWVQATTGDLVDLDRVERDVQAIAAQARAVFGGRLPVERYTFLCVGADQESGGGGLEHRDGAVLMLPVLTEGEDDGVTRTRSLIAHEYLHLWNVKRLVPVELVDLALARPTHTTQLWVAEGWTAYYDDLLPCRAGLTSPRILLDAVRDALRWVLRTPGARRQTLLDASYHAWTGLYVRDENSVNAGTNYYTHGAVVAASLDLLIRAEDPGGHGLDTAFRLLWERFGHDEPHGYPTTGYRHEDVVEALSDAAGRDLGDVVAEHVEGTTPPPLADLLDVVGCRLVEEAEDDAPATLGISLDGDDRGPVAAAVLRDQPAWAAGMTGGDRIVAVDGLVLRRGDLERVLRRLTPGEPVTVTVERAHRLHELVVRPGPPLPALSIRTVDEPSQRQAATFASWCGHAIEDVAGPDDED